MLRKLIAGLLVFFLLCTPAYAVSSSGSALLYSASPRTIVTGSNIDISLSLYDDKLMHNVVTYDSSGITLSADETLEYFPYSKFSWGSSSNDYQDVDFSDLVYRWEITDLDKYNIMTTDFALSMGNLSFVYKLSNSDYFPVPTDSYDKVTYSLLRGTSYEMSSWTSEIPLSKTSFSPGIELGYFGDGDFKGSFSSASTIVGSNYIQTYGLRINFYFDKPLNITDDSYITDFYSGFGEVAEIGSPNYYGENYFSLAVNTSGSSSNTQTEQLDNINTGITNVQNAIDDMKNKLIEMSNTIDAAMRELGSKVENQTQQINNMVTQQTQEIREALGLVGDSIDSGITNIQTSINNQITEIRNGFENITNEVSEGFEKTVESVDKGFADTKKEINEIPNEMKNMLTDFIVPDEDTVSDKMDSFQSLAKEKLGIIYQVPEMMFDAVESLVDGVSNPQTSMTFPAFSLPWVDGSQLRVWDSQEFDIIPAGLDNLRDLIQTITSMVFVIMTFNSLKRAYERFFLGGDN